MAKAASSKRARPAKKASSSSKAKAKTGPKKQRAKPKTHNSAAEAVAGLLETPLVAEVIAAGAAAALATLTEQALSKRADGGSGSALKAAAKAAATAMGAQLSSEFDQIVRKPKRESR